MGVMVSSFVPWSTGVVAVSVVSSYDGNVI